MSGTVLYHARWKKKSIGTTIQHGFFLHGLALSQHFFGGGFEVVRTPRPDGGKNRTYGTDW